MIPGTPAGAESRITVALKDYYLGRAQSGVDLPDWLFSAEERRAAGGAGNTQRGNRAMDSGRDWSGVPPAQYPSESGDWILVLLNRVAIPPLRRQILVQWHQVVALVGLSR